VTAGIPGTGLSWTDYQPHLRTNGQPERAVPSRSAPTASPPGFQLESQLNEQHVETFDSAPIGDLVANSTSELVPILNVARTAIDVLQQLTDEWSRNVERLREASHQFEVKVTFPCPPQLEAAVVEIDKFTKRPGLLR